MPDAFNRSGWLPDDRDLSLFDSRQDSVAFEAKIRHREGLATIHARRFSSVVRNSHFPLTIGIPSILAFHSLSTKTSIALSSSVNTSTRR